MYWTMFDRTRLREQILFAVHNFPPVPNVYFSSQEYDTVKQRVSYVYRSRFEYNQCRTHKTEDQRGDNSIWTEQPRFLRRLSSLCTFHLCANPSLIRRSLWSWSANIHQRFLRHSLEIYKRAVFVPSEQMNPMLITDPVTAKRALPLSFTFRNRTCSFQFTFYKNIPQERSVNIISPNSNKFYTKSLPCLCPSSFKLLVESSDHNVQFSASVSVCASLKVHQVTTINTRQLVH